MRKIARIILWIIGIAFILIQFLPTEYPETTLVNENDLIATGKVNSEVSEILKNSCYDCHSNETIYPWYSYIAPVKWLVISDIKVGRKELNFSEWQTFEKREQIKILEEIAEEVEEDRMPLSIYTIVHGNARLDQDQKKQLISWTETHTEEIFGE